MQEKRKWDKKKRSYSDMYEYIMEETDLPLQKKRIFLPRETNRNRSLVLSDLRKTIVWKNLSVVPRFLISLSLYFFVLSFSAPSLFFLSVGCTFLSSFFLRLYLYLTYPSLFRVMIFTIRNLNRWIDWKWRVRFSPTRGFPLPGPSHAPMHVFLPFSP